MYFHNEIHDCNNMSNDSKRITIGANIVHATYPIRTFDVICLLIKTDHVNGSSRITSP